MLDGIRSLTISASAPGCGLLYPAGMRTPVVCKTSLSLAKNEKVQSRALTNVCQCAFATLAPILADAAEKLRARKNALSTP